MFDQLIVDGPYARGYREGIRTALDAVARRSDEIGRPLNADELRRIGADFDHTVRQMFVGGAA